MEALLLLSRGNKKNLNFTSTDLHRGTGLSEHELGCILDGSILPDYLGEGQPYAEYNWNITEKKKLVLLGCVFHSIQDYSAHSFEQDLTSSSDKEEYI